MYIMGNRDNIGEDTDFSADKMGENMEVIEKMENADVDDRKLAAMVDGNELIEEIGLDRGEIQWRKDFVGFDEEDVRNLENLGDLFEGIKDMAADEFYDHILEYDETKRIVERSTRDVESLKKTQTAYLMRLSSGVYGTSYFADRARIGKIHEMIDMPPKHYIGTYMHYNNIVIPRIVNNVINKRVDEMDDSGGLLGGIIGGGGSNEGQVRAISEEIADKMMSWLRITNLDMQVAIDTYLYSYSQDLRDYNEEMTNVAVDVQDSVADITDSSAHVAERSQEVGRLASDAEENSRKVAEEVSEMSMTVEEIASSAEEVDRMSDEMEERAEKTQDRVAEINEAVEKVERTRAENQEELEALADHIGDLEKITKNLNDFADQTAVLATKAGTHAAELTGEAGEKLRNISDQIGDIAAHAEKRADDADDIIDEVSESIQETAEALEEIEDDIVAVDEASDEATEEIDAVVDSARETSSSMAEISDVTDEQARIAEEIVVLVEDNAESSSVVSEEMDAVVETIEEQNERLEGLDVSVRRRVERITEQKSREAEMF